MGTGMASRQGSHRGAALLSGRTRQLRYRGSSGSEAGIAIRRGAEPRQQHGGCPARRTRLGNAMPSDTIERIVKPADANAQAQHQYFQEVVELRLCLQWNADDYEFANEGGRIVYLMDANVVVFFMNPVLEAHHVDAFDTGMPGRHAVATALVTAEFMFSRGLSGQDGYPALIAASHAEELGDILGAIRPVADTSLTLPRRLPEAARNGLKILIQQVRRGEIHREAAVKELRRLVPECANELLESGYQESNQFLRLYHEDLIRPLAVHSEATKDILDVRQSNAAEIEKWTDIILPE